MAVFHSQYVQVCGKETNLYLCLIMRQDVTSYGAWTRNSAQH